MLSPGVLAIVVAASVMALLVMVAFASWMTVCDRHFGDEIGPGETYEIGYKDGEKRVYTVPNLEMVGGRCKILKPEFLQQLSDLLLVSQKALTKEGVDTWLSGGTLLGFVRHGSIIPWDDDADIHCDEKHIERLFSDEFADTMRKYDLEVFLVRGFDADTATKEAAAVRLRRVGTTIPSLDIFFTERKDGRVRKIDTWNGSARTYPKNENWPEDVIYPLQRQVIDGMELQLPNKPKDFLHGQYGDSALTKMYARHVAFSHAFPMIVNVGQWRTPGNKHSGDDVDQTVPSGGGSGGGDEAKKV